MISALEDFLCPLMPSRSTRFGSVGTGLFQIWLPAPGLWVQEAASTRSAPLIRGRSPSPQASIAMGASGEPDDGKFSCSRHKLPRRSKTISPGANLKELTFSRDRQGDSGVVPTLASSPLREST